jgi:hypothetical protein
MKLLICIKGEHGRGRSSSLGALGKKDGRVPSTNPGTMAAATPDCRSALHAVYFGAWFGGLTDSVNCQPGLEIEFAQPAPIQQHDLPLGWAEEAKDALAVKIGQRP